MKIELTPEEKAACSPRVVLHEGPGGSTIRFRSPEEVFDAVAEIINKRLYDADADRFERALPSGYGYTPATPAHPNCMIEGGGQRDA